MGAHLPEMLSGAPLHAVAKFLDTLHAYPLVAEKIT